MTIAPPDGRWWLDAGAESGVWPCEVKRMSLWPGHVVIVATHDAAPDPHKEIHVPINRVYDNAGNRPKIAR